MRPVVTDRVAWSVCQSVGRSLCLSVTAVSPAKTAEPIEMPFGIWTRVGLHTGATWRTILNSPCAAAMRPPASKAVYTASASVFAVAQRDTCTAHRPDEYT